MVQVSLRLEVLLQSGLQVSLRLSLRRIRLLQLGLLNGLRVEQQTCRLLLAGSQISLLVSRPQQLGQQVGPHLGLQHKTLRPRGRHRGRQHGPLVIQLVNRLRLRLIRVNRLRPRIARACQPRPRTTRLEALHTRLLPRGLRFTVLQLAGLHRGTQLPRGTQLETRPRPLLLRSTLITKNREHGTTQTFHYKRHLMSSHSGERTSTKVVEIT